MPLIKGKFGIILKTLKNILKVLPFPWAKKAGSVGDSLEEAGLFKKNEEPWRK